MSICFMEHKRGKHKIKHNLVRKINIVESLHHFIQETLIYKIYNLLLYNIFLISEITLMKREDSIGNENILLHNYSEKSLHSIILVERIALKGIVFTDS